MKRLLLLTCGLYFAANPASAQCGMTITPSVTNVTCNNGTTGRIVVGVSGGTAPYAYQFSGAGAGAWVTTNNFPSLSAGQYPVSVKDATGCIQTVFAGVAQPEAMTITPSVTAISCAGASTGAISVGVTGGTAPYTYNWTRNGTAYATTQNISGLSTANYRLVVTDAAGCQAVMPGLALPVQIPVTGFTQDVIANGGSTATTLGTTTDGCDAATGAVFFSDQFRNSGYTPGFPATGQIRSQADANRIFLLGGYSANNSLQIANASTSAATLSFPAQQAIPYSVLYVAASCGNGNQVLDYTVNFSDASTQAGSINVADWFFTTGATGSAMPPVKRVTRDANMTMSSSDFTLWEYPINILPANQSKNVTGVSFKYSSGGASNTRANIMGMAGLSSVISAIVTLQDGPASGGTPSVSITSTAPTNQFCSGQNNVFTANPVNGGTSPTYQWSIGGSPVSGATSQSFTYASTATSYAVSVTMTAGGSGTTCLSSQTASSSVSMSRFVPAASVSVSASASNVCSGSTATFTAVPGNAGFSPAYQWRVNGTNVSGATAPAFTTSSLSNGDQVSVVMTSWYTCATGNPATSTQTPVTVNPKLTPTAAISAVRNGMNLNFSSNNSNVGSSPAYQWYKNNAAISGATSASYVAPPPHQGSDYYALRVTPSAGCYSAPAAISNYVTAGVPLPVDWLDFNAILRNDAVSLDWSVAMRPGTAGFSVERSGDGQHWLSLAELPVAGTSYSYTDAMPLSGSNYYRIREAATDGSSSYSAVRKAVRAADASAFEARTYPNPFRDDLRLELVAPQSGELHLAILDMSCRVIGRQSMDVAAGKQSLRPGLGSTLLPGAYQLRIELNGAVVTQRLMRVD